MTRIAAMMCDTDCCAEKKKEIAKLNPAGVRERERRIFYLKSNKMVNTTLANSLLRRLHNHTQYVQQNIQYLQQIYK